MTLPEPHPEVPAACADFLSGLAEWAIPGAARPGAAHVLACAPCADRVRAARASARLLRSLPPAAPPAALLAPSFFEALQARIVRDVETSVTGDALRAAITPVPTPVDSGWEEAAFAATESTPALVGALEPRPAPGWLWSRIRADVRAERASRVLRRRPVFALRFAAAALLVLGIGGALWWGYHESTSPGTKSPGASVRVADIDFVEVDQPLAADASPSLLVRDLARQPTSGR